MKRLIIVQIFWLVVMNAAAQETANVYKTYEDLVHKKVMTIDRSLLVFQLQSSTALRLKNEGELKDLEVWGFSFLGTLNRAIHFKGTRYAKVIAVGDFVLYLENVMTGGGMSSSETRSSGGSYFVSKDLGSPAYRIRSDADIHKLAEQDSTFLPLANLFNRRAGETATVVAIEDHIKKSKSYKDTRYFFVQ